MGTTFTRSRARETRVKTNVRTIEVFPSGAAKLKVAVPPNAMFYFNVPSVRAITVPRHGAIPGA